MVWYTWIHFWFTFKRISKEKNRLLTDNPRKIKGQYLNKGKLHLSKYGSSVLSNNTVNKISKLLHWQIDRSISNASAEECNFKDDLTAKTEKKNTMSAT